MNGTVALESELGKGTRITVEVPFQKSLYPPSHLPRRPSQKTRRSTDASLAAAATSPSALEPVRGLEDVAATTSQQLPDGTTASLQPAAKTTSHTPMGTDSRIQPGIKIQTTLPTPPLSSPPALGTAQDSLLAPRDAYWILLAEDNPLNSEIFVKGLTRMGFNVFAVSNGKDAVDAMAQRPWDLVLMDGQMPICDGYEATRITRRSDNVMVKETTIIALTASAIAGDKERCLEAGMNGYLAKPVRLKVVRPSFLPACQSSYAR